MRTTTLLLLGFSTLAGLVSAQQRRGEDAAAAPTSTVSGHVFFADTNAPARMATVVLQPAAPVDAYDPDKQEGMSSQAEAVQTLLDGSFVFSHVAAGTYYIVAKAPGYISPLASVLRRSGEQPSVAEPISARIAKVVPRVTVQANLPATVNVTLERGAAVSGTVLYDDGSPAAGLNVQIMVRGKEGWGPMPFSPFEDTAHFSVTDDQGAYRISGLPAQEYVVEVDLNLTKTTYTIDGHGGSGTSSNGGGPAVSTYSGNTMRVKEAKAFVLKQGEERQGEDVRIAVTKLHTVRGSMVAKQDGHEINGGSLMLLHADDKSPAGSVSLEKNDDGVFQFNFVPEGDYILEVSGAADYEYEEIPNPPNSSPPFQIERHMLRGYGPAEMPLHVEGDMSGVTVAVPDERKEAGPSNE